MSDWSQAKQQQWNSSTEVSDEYTDEEYTDDEYEPIEATTWGSQSIAEDGSTNVSLSMSGWQSLIDPNIKTKAGGIGSGQLHRRGANYQPVDEQAIIDRRLGKPIPKGGLGGSKKKKSKKPKAGGPPPSAAPRRPVPNSMAPPSSSAYRGREAITTGPWGSAQLSSTPFWEQPANKAGNGSMASKYASAPPAGIAASVAQPQAAAPARAVAPTPAPAPAPAQQQHQFRQPEPAAPAVAPSRPIAQPTSPSTFTRTSQGSAASKYASPSSPAPSAFKQPPPPQPQQPQQPQYQQPPPPKPIYQQNNELPTVSLKLEQPIINLKIELNHGVYASLPVYANEPSVNAVKRLEKEYHLHLDQYHQDNVKQFIEYHVQQYNERQQQKQV